MVRHGGCLGLGLAAMGTAREGIYYAIILYKLMSRLARFFLLRKFLQRLL